ncbi:PKD domain-containing protein, partial [Candidatus Acetothermia bacterium]|nr:PKD domain-containing protein [Candidatus Acetothermia bacterium]
MKLAKFLLVGFLMLALTLAFANSSYISVSAQNASLDDPTVQRIAQAIQDVVQSKVKLLPVDNSIGFAKGATWGITALRDPTLALGLNDVAVLALVDVKQNVYVNNSLIAPGSYYLVKFFVGPNRTEAQLEKDPNSVRVIFISIPPAGANVDLAQQVRGSSTRTAAATVARKLTQVTSFNLIRSEGILAKAPASGEFTLGMTFGSLAACWAISPRTLPSIRTVATNQAPTLTMRPTTPQGFAAIDDDITVDASASRDPDGQIHATAWDFGDDTSPITGHFLTSPVSLKTTHRYEHVGKYSLQFRAIDDQCGYSQLSQSIEIRPWLAVAITLNPDFFQVPAKGPIGLRTDIFNNSLSHRFEGQTIIDVDESP